MKKLLCCILAALVLTGCSAAPKENNTTPEGSEARTVKVGVIGENNEYLSLIHI